MPSIRASRFMVLLVAAALAAPGAPVSAQPCVPDTPTYDPAITSPSAAIPGWPNRRATTAELNDYMEVVGEQSDRVETGAFGESVNGTPLLYSIVSATANMQNLNDVVADARALRDPRRTSAGEAADIARTRPAIVWYTGNVHGGETSGADAAIHILYDLAARSDCEAQDLLDGLVVGVIATQNPDGRDAASRANAYGFDMNRDWFRWTQPETGGKLRVLNRYPPVLFIDAHEMGSSDFFFPPNADPIYHDISDESLHWINDLYGPALAQAFEERKATDPLNWDYFNYDIYDLFYMGYGDTVPTTGFTSAGMTFEKGTADTDANRETEQFVAGWTSLQVAAENREDILNEYHRAHRTAVEEGRRGELEPNLVLQEGNEVQLNVPNLRVRSYFIGNRRAGADVARLVGRLLRMGVEVYRLRRDVLVSDLHAYGRGPGTGRIRKGSYWVPMNQPQKRWIQAMLHEDTYVPFPYFYDVTAWSNPLLENLDAWFTGSRVSPAADRVHRVPRGRLAGGTRGARFFWFRGDSGSAVAAGIELAGAGLRVERLARRTQTGGLRLPAGAFAILARGGTEALAGSARHHGVVIRAARSRPPRGTPVRVPSVAVYTGTGESLSHLEYLLERVWRLPFTPLTGAQVAAGGLTTGGYDVFLVPGVTAADLNAAQEQIRAWIEAGGTFVGTARPGGSGGTPFAVMAGYTTSTVSEAADLQVPGTMFRVRLERGSPLTLGAPRFGYWFHLGEQVMSPSASGANVATFPDGGGDFFVSGYAAGEEALRGSAALVEETLGDGRVILFSGEPNYRAYTEGVQFLLANAIAYPPPAPPAGGDVRAPRFADAVRTAMASALPPIGPGRPIRIEVANRDAAAALAVLRLFTANIRLAGAHGSAFLTIPNPAGLDVEQHPFAYRLLPALRAAGVSVRLAIL